MGRHAYCIIAHDKPEQLSILVELISDARNDIYIHIDKKADIQQFAPPPLSSCKQDQFTSGKVMFLNRRVSVYWGDYSQIICELNLLEAAVRSGVKYDYLHLISGADLPLRRQDEIHDFFDRHAGEEFIDFSVSEFNQRALKNNSEYPYYFGRFLSRKDWFARNIGRNIYRGIRAFVKFMNIKATYDVELQKGSQWFSITGSLAEWLVERRQEIVKTLKHTWCSDEMMLQTFAPLSPYGCNISSLGNLRAIDWTRGNPYVWKDGDSDELMSSHALFARKFSIVEHPGIIYEIINKLKL